MSENGSTPADSPRHSAGRDPFAPTPRYAAGSDDPQPPRSTVEESTADVGPAVYDHADQEPSHPVDQVPDGYPDSSTAAEADIDPLLQGLPSRSESAAGEGHPDAEAPAERTVLDVASAVHYRPPRVAQRRPLPPLAPTPKRPSFRRRHPAMATLIAIITTVGVVALALGGYYAAALMGAFDGIGRKNMLPSENTRPPVHGVPLNFVVIGSDGGVDRSEDGVSGERSDTLLVVHLSGDRQKVYTLSIPRDTYVKIPGVGYNKVNVAFEEGGAALTVRTVEQLLDIKVDHVASVTLSQFPKLVDTLHGVTVQNHHASETQDGKYFFPEGTCQLETGDKALEFVRQRYELPNGDLDRAKRQRAFLAGLIGKVASPETLSNPARVTELMKKGAQLVTVDSGFSSDSIRSLALDMRINSADDVRSIPFPLYTFDSRRVGRDWADVNIIDKAKLADLQQAFKDETLETYFQAHKNDQPVTTQESHYKEQEDDTDEVTPTPTPVVPPPLKVIGRPTAQVTRRR